MLFLYQKTHCNWTEGDAVRLQVLTAQLIPGSEGL